MILLLFCIVNKHVIFLSQNVHDNSILRWSNSKFYFERLNAGGVSCLGGHMTRKMWGFIPVVDCSQLLRFWPSQCKPSASVITTHTLRVDSSQRIMSGKSQRARPHGGTRTAVPARTFPNCLHNNAVFFLFPFFFLNAIQRPAAVKSRVF